MVIKKHKSVGSVARGSTSQGRRVVVGGLWRFYWSCVDGTGRRREGHASGRRNARVRRSRSGREGETFEHRDLKVSGGRGLAVRLSPEITMPSLRNSTETEGECWKCGWKCCRMWGRMMEWSYGEDEHCWSLNEIFALKRIFYETKFHRNRNRFPTNCFSYVYVYENKWRINGIFVRNLTETRPKLKSNVEKVLRNWVEYAGECCNGSRVKMKIVEVFTRYSLQTEFLTETEFRRNRNRFPTHFFGYVYVYENKWKINGNSPETWPKLDRNRSRMLIIT